MKKIVSTLLIAFAFSPFQIKAQNKQWNLHDCLDYALENNIQINKSKIVQLSGEEDLKRAKTQLFPSFSASLSQGFSNYPSGAVSNNNSFSGNYGLNANWTLFEGQSRIHTIKQQQIQQDMNELNVELNEDEIRIAILQTYLQLIYSHEAVGISERTLEVSEAQKERSAALLEAGSISRVDFAQIESQYNSDKYQLVVAKNNLENYKLQLKQLLELDIAEEMELETIALTEEDVLALLPDKQTVYVNALSLRPDIKSSKLAIDIADLDVKKAKSGYLPTLSLSAGISSGYMSNTYEFGDQLWDRLNENVGLSLNIPIFSKRENRTAVNKAQYSLSNTKLDLLSTEKNLLKSVESIYLEAVSSQNQYLAAKERLNYVAESYQLVQQQFDLGMKNTIELVTEKNNYLIAQQELMQSKYNAVMNIQLLNIYQKKTISIK